MLRTFVEKKHTKFAKKASNWQEAIKMSCETLEADKTIDENYKLDIIECVKNYGPYIVLMKDVCMPHSQEGKDGVKDTSIAFMKLEEPVSFEEGNPEYDARLFFTLASCNPEEHLKNMTKLSEILSNENIIQELLNAKNDNDLIKIQEKYLD